MTATIALVDDDRNILTSVSIALQAEGFVTRVYADGEAALKALVDNPPDLAIFDIKMPRMDGLELLRRLREKSQIPVIFLTAKNEIDDETLGLSLGASTDTWQVGVNYDWVRGNNGSTTQVGILTVLGRI